MPGPNVSGSEHRAAPAPAPPTKPRRFYGSVEIDMARPVKAFDTILNSVVMELLRSLGRDREADARNRGVCAGRLRRGGRRGGARQHEAVEV